MLDTYLNIDAALSAVYQNYSVCLVIWLGLLFVRYIQVHSVPRRRGRR